MASFEFANGALGTLLATFDAAGGGGGNGINLYGSDGTLFAPNPNLFDGPVRLLRRGAGAPHRIRSAHGYSGSFRGIGAADMAYATRTGRPHRANGKIACHVVEVMQGIRVAAETGQSQDIESDLERPSPMPPGLRPGELDA